MNGKLFAASLVAALTLACAKENVPMQGQLEYIVLRSAADMTKTTYESGHVYWESDDAISVFSGASHAVKTRFEVEKLHDGGMEADFAGFAEKGTEEYIAVYPFSDADTYDAGTSTLSVAIESEQTACASGFMSGANVSVATSVGNELKFKNIGALVGICMTAEEAANTTGITLKARNSSGSYAGIAGAVAVTLDADGMPSASEGSEDQLYLAAPSGGFVADVVYYMVICPGTYAGFELTFTGKDSTPTVRTTETSCTLRRSEVVTLGPRKVTEADLPDNFTVTLDFRSGSPFIEDYVAVEKQTMAGETYHYPYSFKMDDGSDAVINLEFQIFKVKASDYSTAVYYCDKPGSGFYSPDLQSNYSIGFRFPGIEGRYLKHVKLDLTCSNNSGTPGRMNSAKSEGSGPLAPEFTFPVMKDNAVYLEPVMGQAYYYFQRRPGLVLKTLTLTYTRTKPE